MDEHEDVITRRGLRTDWVQLDSLGRTAWAKTTKDGAGEFAYSKATYDALGRVTRVFEPAGTEPSSLAEPHTEYGYDAFGRVTSKEGADTGEGVTTYAYVGNSVVVTPPIGPITTEVHSALGQLTSVSHCCVSSSPNLDPRCTLA